KRRGVHAPPRTGPLPMGSGQFPNTAYTMAGFVLKTEISTWSNVVVVGFGSPVAAVQPGGSGIPGLRGHHEVPPFVVLKIPLPIKPAYRIWGFEGSISRSVGLEPSAPVIVSRFQLFPWSVDL